MKKFYFKGLLVLFLIFDCIAANAQDSLKVADTLVYGKATYYSKKFHGRRTASGERYSNTLYTAAHANLPFQTKVRVTNTLNNKQVEVKINDRCRRKNKNVIDLSYAAAKELGIIGRGVAPITFQIIAPIDTIVNIKVE